MSFLTTSTRASRSAWTVAAAALILATAGCGGAIGGSAEPTSTPTASPTVSLEEGPDGLMTVHGEDGTTYVVGTSGELPEAWPKDVPVIEGAVVYSTTTSGQDPKAPLGLAIEFAGGGGAALDEVRALLESAGFTERPSPTANEEGTDSDFTSKEYRVSVTVTEVEGKSYVLYVVQAI